jgi:hypothetical protein
MARRVPVFAHTGDKKAARGRLDFFDEETFQTFLKEGGTIILRWEEGDVGLTVKANNPSSESVETD